MVAACGAAAGTGERATSDCNGIAAIYARYSTRFQDSIEDQLRECREWANENGYDVPDHLVFRDEAKRGGSSNRSGLQALQQAIEQGGIDAVVIFATSRLFRKTYRALRFVHEEIVERGIRGVFVKSAIDTDDKDDWEMRLHVLSLVDEYQAKSAKAHIQAAHAGLLLKGRVFGTLTFGYRGEPIPGEKTKRERAARRIIVDPATSPWVAKVFRWYVSDRLSISAIVRRLNEQNAPLSPRCTTGRWTYLAVKTLLSNPRYRGLWQYGRTEAKWVSRKDYVRQVEREKPLQVQQVEELRIIDDETWFRAQELRTNNPHNAGRKAMDGDRKSRPRLLNGLLYCGYHDRPLVVGGGQGRSAICPVCKEDGTGKLYTLLDRPLAVEVICRKIAELIRGDEFLVGRIVDTCRNAAKEQQQPDAGGIEELKAQRTRLTAQIGQVLDLFAETEEDKRENSEKAARLRRQRAGLDADIARLEAAGAKPIRVPSRDEVRGLLADLGGVLTKAAEGNDEESIAHARGIIEIVTGGKILVYQAGPRQPQRGWLKGVFKLRVVELAAESFGVHDTEDGGIDVKVVFRKRPTHEQIASQVKALWDSGLTYVEIAKRVGWNRNIVAKALGYWHESRGLPAPDGREHVKRLNRPKLAERIADRVMKLVNQQLPLKDIAEQLDCSRSRITDAIRIWHERRGLEAPDGRTLRKLRSKSKAS